MKKWLIYTLSLLLTGWCADLHADDPVDAEKKQLLKMLAKTRENDTMRLVILNDLITTSKHPQVEQYYINRLLKEAEKQKNNRYKCEAYLSQIYLAYNLYDTVEVTRWMKILEPLAKKEGYYDLLFLGKRCVVDMLMVKGEYELEEKEAKKMMEEARKMNSPVGIAAATQSLSNIYRMTYRYKEALQLLEENYPVSLKVGKVMFEAGNSLIAVCGELSDYPKMLKWLKIQERNIQRYMKENPDTKQKVEIWLLMTYTYYLHYYTNQNNIPKAEKYLKLADEYYMDGYNSSASFYHYVRFNYFYSTGQFEKALKALDEQLILYRKISPVSYISLLFKKATVYREMNNEDEALAIYDSAFAVKDSIQFAHLTVQTEQLKSDYDSDSLVLEQNKIKRYTRIGLILLIAVVIVILVSYSVHAFRIQKKLKKSEEEMRVKSHEMELANISKEHFLSNISKTINGPLDLVVQGAKLLSSDQYLTSAERTELSGQIDSTATKLTKMVNDILDFSRLEAGMMKYNDTEIELVSFIHKSVTDIAERTGRELSCTLPQAELYIKIDCNRLQSVIENLFSPSELFDKSTFSFTMSNTAQKCFKASFRVEGTLLASLPQTLDIVIMNEINRMIVEHFGGTYDVRTDAGKPSVCFTL